MLFTGRAVADDRADPFAADVLATALYVMGPIVGSRWAQTLDDVGALFLIEQDGVFVSCWNSAMERWLEPATVPNGGPCS